MMPEDLEKLRNARVLVVEDSLSNQTLARDLLQHAGAHVDLAANGREAVVAVDGARSRYDAVLMDLQMPVMDGLEATAIIRERFAPRELPIIVTTANIASGEQERCLEAGATDILPKPFHIHDLYAMLIRWLPDVTEGNSVTTEFRPAPTSRSPAEEALPDSIAGLDMEAGLARVGQDRALYARLLVDFAASVDDTGRAIDGAAAAGDFDRLKFLVHGLRSTAGNIGADALAERAAEIEQAIMRRGQDVSALVTDLQRLLKAARSAIDGAAVQGVGRPPPRSLPLDREEAKGLMASLMDLLHDNDLAALAQFGKLADMLYGVGHDALVDEVAALIDALDFETAQRVLERIGREIL